MFVFDLGVDAAFVWLFISLVILYVWFYRTARSLWIHLNVKYDPHAVQKAKEKGIKPVAPGYVNKNF